jgi:drug/metabolite transporter (DMT)-like permease
MSKTSADVRQYFLKINRTLTTSLVTILIAVSAVFWYTKTVTLENSSFWIGAAFMLLAVVFYQLPYVSYLLTRRYFDNADRCGIEILDSGWKAFKQWLDS